MDNELIIEKLTVQYQLIYRWVQLKQYGLNLSSWFLKRGISRIAIYGIGDIALLLYDELKNEDNMKIVCGIDRDKRKRCGDLSVISLEEFKDDSVIDVIICTPVAEYSVIKIGIEERFSTEIISIEDVLFGLEFEEDV